MKTKPTEHAKLNPTSFRLSSEVLRMMDALKVKLGRRERVDTLLVVVEEAYKAHVEGKCGCKPCAPASRPGRCERCLGYGVRACPCSNGKHKQVGSAWITIMITQTLMGEPLAVQMHPVACPDCGAKGIL